MKFLIVINHVIKAWAIHPLLLLVSTFIFSQSAAALSPLYVCNPDQSTGFEYDEASESWQGYVRDGGDEVLLIDEGPKGWHVKVIGAPDGMTFDCNVSEMNKDAVHCLHESGTVLVWFNEATLRYTQSLIAGYTFDWYYPEGKVSPGMEIGRCVATNQ